MSGGVKVIDLFAGAGGLGLGATSSGGHVALSLELDRFACDTLRLNGHQNGTVLETDICDINGADLRKKAGVRAKEPFILVGGPPCQAFSKAAYWTDEGIDAAYRRARAKGEDVQRPDYAPIAKEDARRDLVFQYWRLITESNATGFLFENVPSIKHPRNRHIYERFVQSAKDSGYHVTELVTSATDFGAAQSRERVFVLGSKLKLPKAPIATHGLTSTLLESLKPIVTAGEALQGLNRKKYFEPEEVVSGRYAQHLAEIPPGWNYKALTEWAGHVNPSFVAETRFWNFLLKLSPDRPSWTIAASPGPWTGPFHWTSRRLRTTELGVLQGFPPSYNFSGPRREVVRQIGNAVPVQMATAMVGAVLESVQ